MIADTYEVTYCCYHMLVKREIQANQTSLKMNVELKDFQVTTEGRSRSFLGHRANQCPNVGREHRGAVRGGARYDALWAGDEL